MSSKERSLLVLQVRERNPDFTLLVLSKIFSSLEPVFTLQTRTNLSTMIHRVQRGSSRAAKKAPVTCMLCIAV